MIEMNAQRLFSHRHTPRRIPPRAFRIQRLVRRRRHRTERGNEMDANESLARDDASQRADLRREQARGTPSENCAAIAGPRVFVRVWALISMSSPHLPSPAKTWTSAVDVFSKPFYRKGPNDQGIGWNV
jgi:hypothetical protein